MSFTCLKAVTEDSGFWPLTEREALERTLREMVTLFIKGLGLPIISFGTQADMSSKMTLICL